MDVHSVLLRPASVLSKHQLLKARPNEQPTETPQLVHDQAAIDVDGLTGDEVGVFRHEKGNRPDHVVGELMTPQRPLAATGLDQLRRDVIKDNLGVGNTRG